MLFNQTILLQLTVNNLDSPEQLHFNIGRAAGCLSADSHWWPVLSISRNIGPHLAGFIGCLLEASRTQCGMSYP